MVYIPEGPFMAGDGSSSASFMELSTTTANVWFISDDNTIQTTAAGACCYYYTNTTNPTGGNEFATGTTFQIPVAFPLGYNAFYAMKYEITEGQYVAFLNSLDATQLSSRNPVNTNKAANTVAARNTITGTTNVGGIGTARPDRPNSYMDWADVCAYLDWAALRPMTELEYEKMARGPAAVVREEFAWGTATATMNNVFSISPEDGSETMSNASANYSNADGSVGANILSQGDAIYGYNAGPVRAGIFADGSTTRVGSGAGYYGNMDLSANLWEYAFCAGNSLAITYFDGSHGDGSITSVGDANFASPKWDSTAIVTGNNVAGQKGGSWSSPTTELRISDRGFADYGDVNLVYYTGRGIREAESGDMTHSAN